jgi:hypothetical protein
MANLAEAACQHADANRESDLSELMPRVADALARETHLSIRTTHCRALARAGAETIRYDLP